MRNFFLLVSCVSVFAAGHASGAVITFTAEDLNAGPGSAHPNSAAMAASFSTAAAALGSVSTITFESAPTGAFTNLAVASGVSINGTDLNGNKQTIMNTPSFPSVPALGGFNTTTGGANYVNVLGGTLTFAFSTPIQAFGAYIDGVQTAFFADVIQFSDGTSQTINVPGTGTTSSNGAWDFVGFTDAGKSITSITLNAGTPAGADEIGVDDVLYVRSSAVTPEPASILLAVAGFGAILFTRVRRLRSRDTAA
jgi:hypothetical protein